MRNGKPILRRYHGIWVCGLVDSMYRMFWRPIGHGSSPKEAFDDWKAQA